jgi:cyclase
MDRDGVRTGYDLDLTRQVAGSVRVPVVASGGAGNAEHVFEAFSRGGASAALLAGILHDELTTVASIKASLKDRGLEMR